MKTVKFIGSLVLAIFCALLVSQPMVASEANQVPEALPYVVGGATLVAAYTYKNERQYKGEAMGVSVEFWIKGIKELLYKDNAFMLRSHNDDDFVLGGSVVHVPQAGAAPTVVKNRDSYPATAVRRTDTDITYALDVFTTTPTHIPKAETMEVSYDKILSVLKNHTSTLREAAAEEMLYNWRAEGAANIIRTSGAADAAFKPHETATGTRKKFMKEDIKKARTLLNKLNVPKEGRVLLINSDFYDQLLDDSDMIKRDKAAEADYKEGIVARLYGFDIMERSTVLMYDNAGTPVTKAIGAVDAATDNFAALAWHPDFVRKAEGTINFFEDIDNPQYYGTIYSALVKLGGRKSYTNGQGVVGIVQAAG